MHTFALVSFYYWRRNGESMLYCHWFPLCFTEDST